MFKEKFSQLKKILFLVGIMVLSLVTLPIFAENMDEEIRIVQDKNRNQKERVSGILRLGKMATTENKEKVRKTLEEVLETDNDKFVREASALRLGALGDKEAIPKLKKALADESGNVKMRAVWSLAKLGDDSGKELVLEALKGNDVTAQLLAVEALEAIGDRNLIPVLEGNLQSENVWTKIYSKLAIFRIEGAGLTGNERLNFLKETLKDGQFEVNSWSAKELAKEGSLEAITILKETAKDGGIPGSYSAGKVLQRLVELGKIKKEDLQE